MCKISGGEPFQAQKQDLIAELKLSKDIEGVKKMKVERLKTEEKQEKELVSEIARQLNASTLLEKVSQTGLGVISKTSPNTILRDLTAYGAENMKECRS